ncbi:replicative DNA helicase [Paenibacillus hexagrammi]|uniref:Replicative DNA helicase n=1 Tax=Paenibacillus hexagrammi TaxID=2908839 RepID=A0ABY3SN65_9BACL|nr:replicative DNA helicase [Paenibacillus sp. YPD9-1]UJF34656.1 replicative DNA helicase [Paenibacillus sp. YPD9-1]
MELLNIGQLVAGFRERMSKLALFDPLYELQRKRQTDRSGKAIDFMELGLLTLLFFFEQKLMRNQKAGVKDLAQFLMKVTGIFIDIDDSEFEELARQLVQTFRPATGKKRDFSFFNWETGQTEHIYISILKANSFDLKTNTQYYTLDEDGLELIFATKEFYMEFQLSIHQLVLRKQLEKGEFEGALRQINEMRIDVESLQERMVKLEHELKRNIVSEETFSRYKSLLDDIYLRLHMENEEFEELRQFVKETKDRVHAESVWQQDQRPYELILQISNELEKVHGEHSILFQQSMVLKTQALHAAKESLYYTGLDSFNFEQDIGSLIFSTPLPLESMKGVLSPFLPIQETKRWSLLTVFAEQNIQEDGDKEARDDRFLELGDDQEGQLYQAQQQKAFKLLMEQLLILMEAEGRVSLSDLVQKLRESKHGYILDRRFFYDFWIYLHQRSPLHRSGRLGEAEEGRSAWLDEMYSLLESRTLIITELPDRLRVNERFTIQNMLAAWGGEENGS